MDGSIPRNPVLVVRERGGHPEAWHRGAFCVVRGEDVVASGGDVGYRYFIRSAAKFFQALAPLVDGVQKTYSLGNRAVALMCASHGGEPEHVEVARSMLAAADLGEDALECGPHEPLHEPSAFALRRDGVTAGSLHNNCSGKHAGMILGALAHGEDFAGYTDPGHPHQRRIMAVLNAFADVPEEALHVAVDGCGAPTFALTLRESARAYGRLGRPPAEFAPSLCAAARLVRDAVTARPLMIAGHDRFCTALVEATRGRVIAKVGAEGFYGATCPEEGLGIALHVDDGSWPIAERVLLALLVELGVLGERERDALGAYGDPVRRNHAKREIGRIRIEL